MARARVWQAERLPYNIFVWAARACPQECLPWIDLNLSMLCGTKSNGEPEDLLRLAGIADLKVISRSSTQQYQSKPRNLREIAKQLGVANILEGSVQKAADQVRVNVQLVNAQTDSHLWADTYDRKLTDIFGVESEIAKTKRLSILARCNAHGSTGANQG
jgi:TolB-like protein